MRADQAQQKAFLAHYLHRYSRHVVWALLFGVSAILATALLDWFFQPEVAAPIWTSRWATVGPMLALAAIAALPSMKRHQQPLIVVFTLIGAVAMLEFARLSIDPYQHYYNNAVVLVTVFCFVLTRVLFWWGVLCAALLFVTCNLYWLGISPDAIDLLVIKNFILFLTCAFSLTATWNLERSLYRNFLAQQANEEERRRLESLQAVMERQSWENEKLADYQTQLSGQQDVATLSRLTLGFLKSLWPVGYAEAFHVDQQGLTSTASVALPGERHFPSRRHWQLGEGMIGEVARQKQPMVMAPPPGYARIQSGTGDMAPAQVVIWPALYENRCTGLVELAMMQPLSDADQTLLGNLMGRFGQALAMAELRQQRLREAS